VIPEDEDDDVQRKWRTPASANPACDWITSGIDRKGRSFVVDLIIDDGSCYYYRRRNDFHWIPSFTFI